MQIPTAKKEHTSSVVELAENRGGKAGRFFENLAQMKFTGKSALERYVVKILFGRDQQLPGMGDPETSQQMRKCVTCDTLDQ